MQVMKPLGRFIQPVKSTPKKISLFKMGAFLKVQDCVPPRVVDLNCLFGRYMEVHELVVSEKKGPLSC